MSVTIRFRGPEGPVSINLEKISVFQITRQRNTCELLAITPENPHPQTPYTIARRDREWQLREILESLEQLRAEKLAGTVFEITEQDARRVSSSG